jgi:3-oxoadipate enol-lactonase
MSIVELPSGKSVNVVRTGPRGGTPIVFVHALGLDLSVWEQQIETFGRDRDVIAMDLPGHGLSASLQASPTFDLLAEVVRDVLVASEASPVDLVGISVGGMIAQTLAAAAPERGRSLTLVATSCTFPEAVRQMLRERGRVAREEGMAVMAPLHLARWFPADFRAAHPDVLHRFAARLLRQDNGFHAAMWDMVATLDIKAALSSVTCPVMIVAGGDDASAPPAAAQLIAESLSAASASVTPAPQPPIVHIVPHSGHFPPLEYPEHFNGLLQRFLDRLQ